MTKFILYCDWEEGVGVEVFPVGVVDDCGSVGLELVRGTPRARKLRARREATSTFHWEQRRTNRKRKRKRKKRNEIT